MKDRSYIPSQVSKPAPSRGEGAHSAFEKQAALFPELCAVTCGEHGLTYGALNRRAGQFARKLRGLGVGPDVLVGLCLGRTIESVIGILAVLKAGGAYVPLDASYPAERLAFMLENSCAKVLVLDPALPELDKVAKPAGLTVLHARAGHPEDFGDAGDDQEDAAPIDPGQLAYVIYTSGSTGRPKGVAMPHGPLVNLLHWQQRACPLKAGERVLQFAPVSFDVSFQEIFSTLSAGGSLALIPDDLRRDPRGLLRFLAEQEIARVFLPPVMLYQLAEQLVNSDFTPSSLREVITAGEALRITPAVVRFFTQLQAVRGGSGCALHNHYGPTETHVATAYTLTGAPDTWPQLPPIGKPIDGVCAELLCDDGQPAPKGEPGSLYLGGECLARGYLHDEELTQRRFIQTPAGRRYQTGDLARWMPDGNLQFLGRADDQVKVRGFRVELGEIEAVLSRHPAIEETAVSVLPDASGAQELVGWVVARAPHPAPAVAELRRWLLEHIPDYMVPSRFVALSHLPLTPSGKVDRRALPRQQAVRSAIRRSDSAPPQKPLEKIIARLWDDVAGIKNPGVLDNFFEAGANSIHAVQVHTRLCQALQREFPITAIFQHATISALATHLEAGDAAAPSALIHERARRQQEQQRAAAARMRSSRAP